MTLKLDDFLSKKKEPAQVLDLSKATVNSKEEFRRLLEKVPEYKIKPEKVKPEDIKIKEKDFTFKTPKRELRPPREYSFSDPVPTEMRGVHLEDLNSVNIQWKMLTTLRPKTRMDDEFFTRLVELGRLRLQTEEKEKRINDSDFIRKMKNRSGVLETRILSCSECSEEFCTGETCANFVYESCQRVNKAAESGSTAGQDEKQERGRSKTRKIHRSKTKFPRSKSAVRSSNREGNRSTSREQRKSKSHERTKSKNWERGKSSSKERGKSFERRKSKSQEMKKSGPRKKRKSKKRGKSKINFT